MLELQITDMDNMQLPEQQILAEAGAVHRLDTTESAEAEDLELF
jgi:hypothetical protein